METKLEIGIKLYSQCKNEIKEHTVTRVGRIYFEVDNDKRRGFLIENLQFRDPDYSMRNTQLYPTKQEIEDKVEKENLFHKLGRVFLNYSTSKLSLSQLRQIKAIIDTP